MNNKGYTIMEAVIAMFLVVVMVGAVFSALMSSRRAIVSSSEREEVFYTLKSTYGMLKDCRSNPDCYLHNSSGLKCTAATFEAGEHNLENCNGLFTSNFGNLCKKGTDFPGNTGAFKYTAGVMAAADTPQGSFVQDNGKCSDEHLKNFYTLNIVANCSEAL